MRLDLGECQFTETDRRGYRAASTRVLGYRCLQLPQYCASVGARPAVYCVLRMESSPLAPSAFHDTCCIIALSLYYENLPVT